jgi:uncharacterized repeat protein (TIGR03803 family)
MSWTLLFLRRLKLALIFVLCASCVSLANAQQFKTLLSFPGGTDGADPQTASIVVSSGNIFGATSQGGNTGCSSTPGCGVIYKLSLNGSETVLYSFGGATFNDGAGPNAPILNPGTHELEGTTSGGGINTAACVGGCGTAYALDSSGNETMLHVFSGSPDANLPLGAPVLDAAGNLYGVSFYGGGTAGQTGNGTVFTVSSTGQESLLYRFKATPDGTNPNGALVRDAAGNLYGTTTYGGAGSCNNGFLPGCGVVFKIDSSGNETILHSFTGGSDSQYPTSLVQDGSGNLFGAANYNSAGVIFKLDSSGNFSVIYSGSLAAGISNLVLRPSGGFFITVTNGGSTCPNGCVAELLPNGSGYKPLLLKAFDGTDGSLPDSLVLSKGALYGTTYQGGSANFGTVFTITP